MITARLRVGIQQRVLPFYRGAFFDTLAADPDLEVMVFAGSPRPGEDLGKRAELSTAALFPARNIHLFSNRFYLCLQSNWEAWLQAFDPEILILEANPRYLHLPAAIRWMHQRRRPVIGWGLGAPAAANKLITGRKRAWLRQFDTLVAYSQAGKEQYAALGFPADRIIVAPNAATRRPEKSLPNREPGTGSSKVNVLFVGRLQERKNVDMLIRACGTLPEELQPGLVIVGEGETRHSLERLAADVYPRTVFTGALYGDDLDAEYNRSDLFVLPGTGGLAVQQAMAHALPVIVAEADGTQQDLVQQGNGWRITPGDEDNLQQVLLQALRNPIILRQMGEESFRIVQHEVNIEVMAGRFKDAIALARKVIQ